MRNVGRLDTAKAILELADKLGDDISGETNTKIRTIHTVVDGLAYIGDAIYFLAETIENKIGDGL